MSHGLYRDANIATVDWHFDGDDTTKKFFKELFDGKISNAELRPSLNACKPKDLDVFFKYLECGKVGLL